MKTAPVDLFRNALSGVAWTGLGTVSQVLAQGAVLVVLARLLTPEEFGLAAAALMIVGLSAVFAQFGVGPALVQRPELERRHVETGFGISLALGGVAFALVRLSAGPIETFFGMNGLEAILRVAAWVFPLRAASIVAESIAQRELRFRLLSLANGVSYVLGYAVVAIVSATLGLGALSLVLGYLAQVALYSAVLLLRGLHSPVPRVEVGAVRDLAAYGTGFTLDVLGNYVALQGDYAVVGRRLGADALGVYSRAYQMVMLPVKVIGTVLDRVLFPIMASFQDDVARLRRTYRRGLAAVAIMTLPLATLSILLGEDLVLTVLGSQWGAVVVPFQILVGSLLFRTGYKIGDSLTRATGVVFSRAWRQWIYAGSVVLAAALGSGSGTAGVAMGVTLAILLNYLLVGQLSMKVTQLSWRDFLLAHLPGARLAAVWGAVCWVLVLMNVEPGIGRISLALVLALSSTLGLVALWPQAVLGPDGAWFVERLTASVKQEGTS